MCSKFKAQFNRFFLNKGLIFRLDLIKFRLKDFTSSFLRKKWVDATYAALPDG